MRQILNILFTVGIVMTGIAGLNTAHAQPGDALDFDGNDDYVDIEDNLIDNYSSITIEAWIKPNSFHTKSSPTGHNDNENSIVHKAGSGNDNMGLTVVSGGFSFYLDNGSSDHTLNSSSSINSGEWVHIAAVYDGSNMEIYINGVLDASSSSFSNSLYNSPNNLRIGGNHGAGSVSNFEFDGEIDEVRIWSKARAQSDIREYMHQVIETPSNFSSLKGYWKMDDGSPSSTTTDATGNNNNGTLQNGPAWVTSEAVLTDATNELHAGNTFSNDLAAIWPVINTASSGGLQITPNSSNPFSTSDDVVFGHNGVTGEDNQNSSSYNRGSGYPSGPLTVESRLNREWYVDDNAGSKTVDFVFTTSDAGTGNFGTNNDPSDLVLIEVISSGNDVIVQSANTVNTGSNSTITFTNVDVNSTYTVGTTNESGSPLPVELTSFKVKNVQRTALIAWSTASEIHNSHFLIQRMDQDWWKTIGRVKGHGTTTEPQRYNFRDQDPIEGLNYYRLKQVDLDGSHEYSDVRAVRFDKSVEDVSTRVALGENPVADNLTLTLKANQTEHYQYTLVNLQGKPVSKGSWHLTKGTHALEVPMQGLSDGAYFLRIKGGQDVVTRKVMK